MSNLKSVSAADFVQAMGLHVASVCIITTRVDEQNYGLTATAVSSVSAEPPRLLVCINKTGMTYEKIVKSGCFALSVATEHQEDLAKSFAGMMGKTVDRFASGKWGQLTTGSPVLHGAAAAFDCRIVQTFDQGTHSIFIGEVLAVTAKPGEDALLYGSQRFRHLRKLNAPKQPSKLEMLDG
jgi:flavin reductase (DIM6/NTAB) family NADH-FMN oxidoreductase RutF